MSDDNKIKQSHSPNDNHTPIQHVIDFHMNKKQQEAAQTSHSKEGEPMRVQQSESSNREDVSASEVEPTIEDRELDKYIEVKTDVPEIHPELKKAGLLAIDTTSLDPKQRIHLPIPDEKVLEGKEQPVSSGFRWLAEIALFMLKRAHLTLKKVHGKVVRVILK